jgi:hypothetical protein
LFLGFVDDGDDLGEIDFVLLEEFLREFADVATVIKLVVRAEREDGVTGEFVEQDAFLVDEQVQYVHFHLLQGEVVKNRNIIEGVCWVDDLNELRES